MVDIQKWFTRCGIFFNDLAVTKPQESVSLNEPVSFQIHSWVACLLGWVYKIYDA